MNIAPTTTAFLGAPLELRPAETVAFAFLGAPLYIGYDRDGYGAAEAPPGAPAAAGAADAVRAAAAVYAGDLDHYDFDLGGPFIPEGAAPRFVDCGNVSMDGGDPADRARRVTDAVRAIVGAGAVPLVVAGDHSAPPAVVRGLDDSQPLDVLHIDAHLDYRDEVEGVREGYSSPIRRLRELPWVRTVVQVGLRDIGSARPAEVEAARAAGNVLVTADEVHERGVGWIAELFPSGGRVYVTIDVDGLDPSCAPGTLWPAPGGLTFAQLSRLLRSVLARSEPAGVDICEFAPARDPQGHTALMAARLLMLVAGAALRR
jgi:agmatinase